MTRDVAPRLKFHKPSLIMSRFFPALQVSFVPARLQAAVLHACGDFSQQKAACQYRLTSRLRFHKTSLVILRFFTARQVRDLALAIARTQVVCCCAPRFCYSSSSPLSKQLGRLPLAFCALLHTWLGRPRVFPTCMSWLCF